MRLALALLGSVPWLVATPARGFSDLELGTALAAARDVVGTVARLAADDLDGRDNATQASESAQEFLIDSLAEVSEGLDASQEGDDAFRQPFGAGAASGVNLLGLIPGRELPEEYVIVGAHYDHLGSACAIVPSASDVCNGATDDAAGVAAVIAIGRALRTLPTAPRRSVVLALWDAEEDGLLGSAAYRRDPLVPYESTVAYVNFDILGANLLPSARNLSFALGAETGGEALRQLTADAVAAQSLDTRRLSVIFGQNRSDHTNFFTAGVPSVFFSDATGPCYHTTGDELGVVDFRKLREQSQIGLRLVLALAEAETPPSFVPIEQLATWEDAANIADVITGALEDLDLFPSNVRDDIEALETFFRGVADAGPEAFDPVVVGELLGRSAEAVDLLTTTECDGFLPEPASSPTQGMALAVLAALAARRRSRARRA